MRTISFVAPGIPAAQPRHRVANGHAYIPGDHAVHGFRDAIILAARDAMKGEKPITGSMAIVIEAVFPRVAARPKYIAKDAWKSGGRLVYQGNKDWDNIGKAVCDALIGWCYDNDHKIIEGIVRKEMAGVNEMPHTKINITEI